MDWSRLRALWCRHPVVDSVVVREWHLEVEWCAACWSVLYRGAPRLSRPAMAAARARLGEPSTD